MQFLDSTIAMERNVEEIVGRTKQEIKDYTISFNLLLFSLQNQTRRCNFVDLFIFPFPNLIIFIYCLFEVQTYVA